MRKLTVILSSHILSEYQTRLRNPTMHFTLDTGNSSSNGGRIHSEGQTQRSPHPASDQPLPDKGLLASGNRTMHTHTLSASTEE